MKKIILVFLLVIVYGAGEGPPIKDESAKDLLEGKSDKVSERKITIEEGKISTPSEEKYIIQPGDTLWDISSRLLNSPWYWPKLWSYNPYISNPHWIYPGNELRLTPGGEEMPTLVETYEPIEEKEPKELSEVSMGTVEGVGIDVPEELEGAVSMTGKIVSATNFPPFIRRDTFVSKKELEYAGRIISSFEEKFMLSTYDSVYVKFANISEIKVNDRFMIFDKPKPIKHPKKKDLIVGYVIEIIGGLKIVKVDEDIATGQIFTSYSDIQRGMYVLPWQEDNIRRIKARPPQVDSKGYIVYTTVDDRSMSGEHHLVVIDKGRDDGIFEGNVFFVVKRGDQLDTSMIEFNYKFEGRVKYPDEVIGAIMVIDARDKASTGIVLSSLRELVVGDEVVTKSITK
ncbi:MAG: LysM peptidoglycan-binding domain-containing protein [Deltaproteobacteria bacterium]|nr:LysM peptidoglycan-binding domain-containing protein [Deltaproteobacteria bacterium]